MRPLRTVEEARAALTALGYTEGDTLSSRLAVQIAGRSSLAVHKIVCAVGGAERLGKWSGELTVRSLLEALAHAHSTESVLAAARRTGINHARVSRWLRKAGLAPNRSRAEGFRWHAVRPEDVDRVVAEQSARPIPPPAATHPCATCGRSCKVVRTYCSPRCFGESVKIPREVRAEAVRRWEVGESLGAIGQALGINRSSVRRAILAAGYVPNPPGVQRAARSFRLVRRINQGHQDEGPRGDGV